MADSAPMPGQVEFSADEEKAMRDQRSAQNDQQASTSLSDQSASMNQPSAGQNQAAAPAPSDPGGLNTPYPASNSGSGGSGW